MKKETFEPVKQKCTCEQYHEHKEVGSYRIYANGDHTQHIKTTTLKYVVECVDENGFIWIENNSKAFSVKEKTLIRLEVFRGEIKKLYKNYPETVKTIDDSPVKTRNMYRSPTRIDEETGKELGQKYGISFENRTSIFVPERIFNLLEEIPVRHLNL